VPSTYEDTHMLGLDPTENPEIESATTMILADQSYRSRDPQSIDMSPTVGSCYPLGDTMLTVSIRGQKSSFSTPKP
jgi:hypothetical protein